MWYTAQTAKVLETPWQALTATSCLEAVLADSNNTTTAPAIISRAEAIAAGLKRYWTGAPCKHGHLSERHTHSRVCLECHASWRSANADKMNATQAAYAARNAEKIRARMAEYRAKPAVTERRALYLLKNAEKIREQKAENYAKRVAADPARIVENRARAKAWGEANRERVAAKTRAYYAANRDEVRAQNDAWAAANPDKMRAISRNRRARERAADGYHTAADVNRIYETQCGKCAYCKKIVGKKYHVDHIQPLAKGGSNWPSNLQILCAPCNNSKGARDPVEHAQSLGLLL